VKGIVEHASGKLETDAVLGQIPAILGRVPNEPHQSSFSSTYIIVPTFAMSRELRWPSLSRPLVERSQLRSIARVEERAACGGAVFRLIFL
jgi:hypothetical protein